MATRITSFAAILNILTFARDKKWNQNDNTSNMVIGNTFKCQWQAHRDLPCFYVPVNLPVF